MLRKPNPVQYFAAVMYNENHMTQQDSENIVKALFGEHVLKSELFCFDHTRYYEPEMGGGLKKYFAAFGEPSEPSGLPELKLNAINEENRLAVDGKRIINIDPAYLALEKVVVASTKNFTHRIYLDKGIFGDLQLMRQKTGYVGMPWTYADYVRQETIDFINELSKRVGGK